MEPSIDPFLTNDIPGIGGQIRATPEDFQVEERPLYLPCGEGEHLYVRITKRGLSTPDLVRRLSSTLGVRAQGIDSRVVVLVGDAELDEGSNHEAIEFAAAMGLDSLTAVVIALVMEAIQNTLSVVMASSLPRSRLPAAPW